MLGLDPAKVNTAMVALQRPDPDDLVWLHDAVTRHARFTGSTLARSVLSRLAAAQRAIHQIMPTDYQKVLEATGWPRRRDVTSIRRSWRRLVADPTGFLRVAKVEAPKRPVDERVGDWREVYEPQDPQGPRRRGLPASPALHGLRNSVLPLRNRGLPAGQPDPGMERPGAPRSLGRRQRAPARHQQLPGVHRQAVPGPVRGGLRALDRRSRDRGAVTIKRIENTIADQAWRLGIVEPQPAAIGTGRSVAVVGSGPAGLAAAQQLTRAGHHVTVYERDDRLGGLLRYGIPEYKLEKATLNQRLAQMRAEGTRFVTDCERSVSTCPSTNYGTASTRWCSRSVRSGPATPKWRAETWPAFTWRWTIWCRPTGNARATGRRTSRPPAGMW